MKNRLNYFRDNRTKVLIRTNSMKIYIGIITEIDCEKITLMCDGLISHKIDMIYFFDVSDIIDVKIEVLNEIDRWDLLYRVAETRLPLNETLPWNFSRFLTMQRSEAKSR
jgi:hypothetical protein